MEVGLRAEPERSSQGPGAVWVSSLSPPVTVLLTILVEPPEVGEATISDPQDLATIFNVLG
jgi:hypothetical protein